MKHAYFLWLESAAIGVALLAVPQLVLASDTDTVAPTATSRTFAATSHRRFDDVEYWSGVFDDPERAKWQKPDEIVRSLALSDGDRVADLGAGTGYILSRLSESVGEDGTVYAVEIEPKLVEHIRARIEAEGLANVIPVLTSTAIPRLPRAGVDLILILDTYHHLDERKAYLSRLGATLAEGGRIAIIDWKKGELPIGPPPAHKLARQQVVDEMTAAGFALTAEPALLENQYFLIFAKAP